MSRRAPGRLRAALLAAAALASGCGGEPGPAARGPAAQAAQDPAADGHLRMVALLRELAGSTPLEHPYLGSRKAERLRAERQRLGDEVTWQLLVDLGIAELRLGNERAGIEVLAAAERGLGDGSLAGDADARTWVRFQLGVAWLRLGETENCCAVPAAESCILPFTEAARHARPEGSRNAARCFLAVLEATPETSYWHLAARWLLNLAHQTLGTWPDGVPERHRVPAAAFTPEPGFPRFANTAPALGLDTMSLSGGAIADDFDGDGHLDLLVSTWDPRGQLRFFANRRDGTFADRTDAAGLLGLLGGLNLVQADYDNDGDLDFLVLRGAWLGAAGRHPNSLVRNDGGGTFTDVTFAAGLGDAHWPTQTAAFADYDRDGDLDLYVGNETTSELRCPCQLFRNDGDGTFTDVARAAGVADHGFVKAVAWGDYDGDLWPDLYVSHLDGPNRLFRNRGDGTFTDVAPELGVTGPERSFPAWFWDFDNDGALDLFVSSYCTGIGHVMAFWMGLPVPDVPRLYRGDGRGGFREVGRELGLAYPSMPMGSNFGDLDGDGWLDFYLGTGDTDYQSLMPNLMYRSEGGRAFRDVTLAGGFGHLQKGHAVAFADFDHDGDLDVFEQMGGAYPGDAFRDALYQNPGFNNRWIAVELAGTRSNRSAIGARIRVEVEDGEGAAPRSIFRHVGSGGSFGANPLRQTIGLGRATALRAVEVTWPATGAVQRVEDVPFDRFVRIVEGREGCETLAPDRLTPRGR